LKNFAWALGWSWDRLYWSLESIDAGILAYFNTVTAKASVKDRKDGRQC